MNSSCFKGQIIIQGPIEAAAHVGGAAGCAEASVPTDPGAQSDSESSDMEVEEMEEQEDEKMDVDESGGLHRGREKSVGGAEYAHARTHTAPPPTRKSVGGGVGGGG